MDVVQLPTELVLHVMGYLTPREVLRCRRVCRRWRDTFAGQEVSRMLLHNHFPHCRELGLAKAASLLEFERRGLRLDMAPNFRVEVEIIARDGPNFAAAFAAAAERYHNLRLTQPRSVEKIEMARAADLDQRVFRWKAFAPWRRYLLFNSIEAPFHHADPMWWYSREDGALVYPTKITRGPPHDPGNASTGFVYQLLDLDTKRHIVIPFDVREKYLRRVRLAQGVLIFEWAKPAPCHMINRAETAYYHFATIFDVMRIAAPRGGRGPKWNWTAKFRSEVNIHPSGFALNDRDRVFSAHNGSHYAVYSHRENRTQWGQQGGFEQLSIWDISSPSPHRLSMDKVVPKAGVVAGVSQALWTSSRAATVACTRDRASSRDQIGSSDTNDENANQDSPQSPQGPFLIRQMNWPDLDFYGVRQRDHPQLRHLALDKHSIYFVEEEHRWARGTHTTTSLPRVHMVKSTGIPIIPFGTDNSGTSNFPDMPVFGPRWMDICGADADVHLNFCRHINPSPEETAPLDFALWNCQRCPHRPDLHYPLSTRRTPEKTQIRTGPFGESLRSYISDNGSLRWRRVDPEEDDGYDDGDDSDNSDDGDSDNQQTTIPWNWRDPQATPWPWSDADDTFPPSRWPGYAPCWRHAEFPYLTVSEMIDFSARVRISASRCIVLESLSVHIPPALLVKGPQPPEPVVFDGDYGSDSDSDSRSSRSSNSVDLGGAYQGRYPWYDWEPSERPRGAERQLSTYLWTDLMGAGTIAGDERWIVGQSRNGEVTIVRF